jgi:hypothetical protein
MLIAGDLMPKAHQRATHVSALVARWSEGILI